VVRRTKRRRSSSSSGISQLPWTEVRNPYPATEILSADQIEAIHQASLTLLERVGLCISNDEARRHLAAAGAEVDEEVHRVRFDPALVMESVAKAPSNFTLRARNPQHDISFGGNRILFSSIGGPAYCSDLVKGRRPGSYQEMCDYMRLVQSLNIIHQEGGAPFEPLDLPVESRHLDIYLAQARFLDKNSQCYPLGRERTRDAIEMACITLKCSKDELAKRPAVMGIINTNSPLLFDSPMAGAVIELAQANQVCCVTPFTLAGAMSPITLAGTLAQMNAEVLAIITLAQVIRPGAPVIYGSFSSNVDMKSGSPAFGTPEYTKCVQASTQLARFYQLPVRSSNTTASNVVDPQSTYESMMSLWACVTGHVNLVNHAAGWLEGGLTASFEKLIVDAEILQMLSSYLQEIEVSDDTLALSTIEEVGPSGHFFGTAHTLERYETAFYQPMLSDWRNFETWEEGGSIDAAQRACNIWQQLLREYQQPTLDASIDEALVSYVARRKESIAVGI